MLAFVCSLVFFAALGGGVFFDPAWNPEIPPDAFYTAGNSFKSITLSCNGQDFTLSKAVDAPEGLLREFPFFTDGVFIQIKTKFDDDKISGFNAVSGELDINVEFLEYANSLNYKSGYSNEGWITPPALARVNSSGTYSFISFAYGLKDGANEIIETWFSEEGVIEAVLTILMSVDNPLKCSSIEINTEDGVAKERFFYDSFGNRTASSTLQGEYSAVYNEKGPRYLARSPSAEGVDAPEEEYQFDFNRAGLLLRSWKKTIFSEEEPAQSSESVYKYKFDPRGAWTEREETVLKEALGFYFPQEVNIVRRGIEY